MNYSCILLQSGRENIGPFVATSTEILMDLLSRIAKFPPAEERSVFWDGLLARQLRAIGADLSVLLRPLRRFSTFGPDRTSTTIGSARSHLRHAENALYRTLSERNREPVRTNRLDPLLVLEPSTQQEVRALAGSRAIFTCSVRERQCSRRGRSISTGGRASAVLSWPACPGVETIVNAHCLRS